MQSVKLGEVFKTNGVPTHTYVEPYEYQQLLANLTIPGRGLVLEGPSGIGKTTAIKTAIKQCGLQAEAEILSARNPEHLSKIAALRESGAKGVIVIDDFHRLEIAVRRDLAEYLKYLADTEDTDRKLVIVGINKAGHNLIALAEDLVARMDIIHFDANPSRKIEELVEKGLAALNLEWTITKDIANGVLGSLQLAQLACFEICVELGVQGYSSNKRLFNISFESAKAKLWKRLDTRFRTRTEHFCRGPSLKKGGRAPYLQILNWLACCKDWTLDLRQELERRTKARGSVAMILDRGHLKNHILGSEELQAVLFFDEYAEHLSVEDPQYLFYLTNIPWNRFAKEVGFANIEFKRRYDFALSFAGHDRALAKEIFETLTAEEFEVFYDFNESFRILAQDVEDYLGPIYHSEAHFIVVLLSAHYPQRVWTKFESDAFRERTRDGTVIPVLLADAVGFPFSEVHRLGSYRLIKKREMEPQIKDLCRQLTRKMTSVRHNGD